jgi:putative endonuclease
VENRQEGKKGYVYLLTNDRGNVLYIGSTQKLKARLDQHKPCLIPGFTKKYNVHELDYFEEFQDLDLAEIREKQLKGKKRTKKNEIVQSVNPKIEECRRQRI